MRNKAVIGPQAIFIDSSMKPLEPAPRHPARSQTGSIPEKYLSFKARAVDTQHCKNTQDWLSKMDLIFAVTTGWHLAENLHNNDVLFLLIGKCNDINILL